ncbi:hypothetical protein BDW69DRAFT_180461 [Aspergillus filifer]
MGLVAFKAMLSRGNCDKLVMSKQALPGGALHDSTFCICTGSGGGCPEAPGNRSTHLCAKAHACLTPIPCWFAEPTVWEYRTTFKRWIAVCHDATYNHSYVPIHAEMRESHAFDYGQSSRYLLSQIDVHKFDDDTFFQALRSEYYRLRGRMRNWFSVWRYSHCDFYQFHKFDDAAYAPKLKDDYPQTRDDYEYNPDPMDIIPPITEHEFYCRFYSCFRSNGISVHLLHSCRKAGGNSSDALNLLPKKKVRLEEYGDKRQMFWGIYAREVICFRWVVAYNIVCLVPMVIFLFLWMFPFGYKGDLQNAAVPLTAMLGLLTLFWGFFIGNIKFRGLVYDH